MTCTFHPDRETLLGCSRCERPACPDCLRDAPVGQHCLACVAGHPVDREIDPALVRRLTQSQRKQARARTGSKRPGWAFYALVALFIGACAATYPLLMHVLMGEWYGRLVAVAVVVLGVVVSVVLHEYGHAVTALWGGDRGVVSRGYLTLDIRRYAHPLLTFVMPALFVAVGWLPLPGGAVLVDEHRLKSPGWSSLVSLAGSLMNLVFTVLLAAVVSSEVLLPGNVVLHSLLAFLVVLEVSMIILNLLPIPGLDGWGVIEPLLPRSVAEPVNQLRPYGLFILFALLFTGGLGFVWDAGFAVASLLGVDPRLADLGISLASFS